MHNAHLRHPQHSQDHIQQQPLESLHSAGIATTTSSSQQHHAIHIRSSLGAGAKAHWDSSTSTQEGDVYSPYDQNPDMPSASHAHGHVVDRPHALEKHPLLQQSSRVHVQASSGALGELEAGYPTSTSSNGGTGGLMSSSSFGGETAQQRKQAQLVQRCVTLAVCLSWTLVSSGAILMNKYLMVDLSFKYPCTIAWLGLFTTTVCSYTACEVWLPRTKRYVMTPRYYCQAVLPTGLFMGLTFITGNMGYLYLTVAFVQMLKAFCPVVTMALLFVTRLESATPKLVATVMMIACGVALASYGELHLSLLGLAAMSTSVVAESVRLVLTQLLLVGNSMHPLEGLMYIGSACTLWLLLLACLGEWPGLVRSGAYRIALDHPLQFALAAASGFGVNLLAILVIKLQSSLTLKVLGTVKDAALIFVGFAFLHEMVTPLQLVGYSISMTGFLLYNVIKMAPGKVLAGKAS